MTGHIHPMAQAPIQPAAAAAEIAALMAECPPVTLADRLRVERRDVWCLRQLWQNFGEVETCAQIGMEFYARRSETVTLDHVLDLYAQAAPMPVREWTTPGLDDTDATITSYAGPSK